MVSSLKLVEQMLEKAQAMYKNHYDIKAKIGSSKSRIRC